MVINISNNLTQMKGSQISIEIPESVLEVTNADAATFAVQLRILAAVKLYEMGHLSSSKAAQLAGMSRVHLTLAWAKHLDSTFVFLCHRLSPKCFAPT